jgi:hypothetical protein
VEEMRKLIQWFVEKMYRYHTMLLILLCLAVAMSLVYPDYLLVQRARQAKQTTPVVEKTPALKQFCVLELRPINYDTGLQGYLCIHGDGNITTYGLSLEQQSLDFWISVSNGLGSLCYHCEKSWNYKIDPVGGECR